jgi:hypothetical protein
MCGASIVFGMFGLVLFDRPAVLFATFAALKTVVDLGAYLHRGAGGIRVSHG